MKITVTETRVSIEGAEPVHVEGASAEDRASLARIKAVVWAAEQLQRAVSVEVAKVHARHAIEAARASP